MLVLDKAPCRTDSPTQRHWPTQSTHCAKGKAGQSPERGQAMGRGSEGRVGALLPPPQASEPSICSAPFSSPGAQPATEAHPDSRGPRRLPRRSPSTRVRTGETSTLHVRASPACARGRHGRHSPQPDGQQVGQQQRRQEDLEELGGEDAALLHDARVAHAERGGALRVPQEQELPAGRGGQRAPAPGPRGPRGRRLTWLGGCSLADWTNPKSSLSFSSGCFRPLSSSPCSLPRTAGDEVGEPAASAPGSSPPPATPPVEGPPDSSGPELQALPQGGTGQWGQTSTETPAVVLGVKGKTEIPEKARNRDVPELTAHGCSEQVHVRVWQKRGPEAHTHPWSQ